MHLQQQINTVVQYLFREEELGNVPVSRLRQFVTEHPYSAAGRYLLIKKLKDEALDDFESEMETSVLYYNNPLWLQFLLDSPAPPELIHHEVYPPAEETGHAESEQKAEPQEPEALDIPAAAAQPETPAEVEASSTAPPEAETQTATPGVPAPEPDHGPQAAEPLPTPATTLGEGPIAFEPFYTIDYFASQGIKLRKEDLDKDQFGRQLKSFTDWLRSMKRISPQAETVEDASSEQAVQAMAGLSVEGSEAETEAMAEVWRKQGNRAKAIAIYEKLSLRNPGKSHYFAAKIEELKA